MFIELKLRGLPIAQKRAKVAVIGGFARVYDPSKKDKSDIVAQIKQSAPEIPITTALRIDLTFFFPRPNNHFGTGKNADLLKSSVPPYPSCKPDLDNLAKIILDCMNKLYYRDDSQIVCLTAIKLYAESPGTKIVLSTLEK